MIKCGKPTIADGVKINIVSLCLQTNPFKGKLHQTKSEIEDRMIYNFSCNSLFRLLFSI